MYALYKPAPCAGDAQPEVVHQPDNLRGRRKGPGRDYPEVKPFWINCAGAGAQRCALSAARSAGREKSGPNDAEFPRIRLPSCGFSKFAKKSKKLGCLQILRFQGESLDRKRPSDLAGSRVLWLEPRFNSLPSGFFFWGFFWGGGNFLKRGERAASRKI